MTVNEYINDKINMFKDCKIIVKSESDKIEFIRACKHLHDFSVMWNEKTKKVTEVVEEFGDCVGDRDLGKNEAKVIDIKELTDSCGISLSLDEYPFVNFLAHLYDCEDLAIRDKFIIVEEE